MGLLCLLVDGQAAARAVGSSVYVNELLVVTLRSSYKGSSPASRAAILARKLDKLGAASVISLRKVGGSHQLLAGKELLVVVSAAEAAAQKSQAAALARAWAGNISEALTLPALRLSEEYVRLPAGRGVSVLLAGTRALKATVRSSDEAVVRAERKPGSLILRGTAYGSATVTVVERDALRSIRVEVLPYAANLPQNVAAQVTGTPATVETVRGAIESAARTRLNVSPMAQVTLLSAAPRNLRPGESATFQAKVRVEAPEAYPSEGVVNVLVRNVGLAMRHETELWYCNHPETVQAPGPLFAATLREFAPARLLYHHINDSPAGMFLEVRLINESDTPARVLVIPGDSGPDRNPVQAGILAAEGLLRLWVNYSGEILEIPARSAVPLSLRRFGPRETISGLAVLRLLEGGPGEIRVRTDARVPNYADGRIVAALASSSPWRIVGSRLLSNYEPATGLPSPHIYPNPFKTEEVVYRVGGRYGFVRLGQRPIASVDQTRNLDGNFGVFYTIHALLENPSEAAADLEVVFEASAGYSGALFVVNGEVRKTPLLQAKSEFRVVRVRLGPGESRELSLLTVPLSGSSYPATVTFRPLELAVPTWPGGPFR